MMSIQASARRVRDQRWPGAFLALAGLLALASNAQPIRAAAAPTHPTRAGLAETYAKQPLAFEPNNGQAGARVQFLSRGLGYSLFLTSSEAVLAVHKTLLRMTLTGANAHSAGIGLAEVPGRINYFIGNDPRKWKTDIRTFAKVKYQDVYPGVDLIYYGNQRQLEYDFIVAPGASPKAIRLAIDGASSIHIDGQGDLVLKYRGGAMRFHKPVAYQPSGDGRTSVDSRYVLRRHHQVGFEIAAYDANKPLVIDPVVTYATYLGGDKDVNGQPAVTDGFGITVDPSGNIYVVGSTDAINDGVFPVHKAFQPTPPTTSVTPGSAFVAKLDAAGNPVYVTYLGGSQDNRGLAVAADANGNASVTGWTSSNNFPVTAGAFQSSPPGGLSSFMTRFGPTGGLLYSTYVASGRPGSVVVDGSGNAYLTGSTDATFSGKTTPGAYQKGCAAEDTYIVKLSPANPAAALYASCLASKSAGSSIALDAAGNIYVAGQARTGTDFLVKNGFQTAVAGSRDAFVAKLFPGGVGTADLLYSTLFGGSQNDGASGIAVDAAGNAYIAGNTGSADLPVTSSAIPVCLPVTVGHCAAFVAKFNTLAAGAASRIFATYLGGSSGVDDAEGIAVDSTGNAFVAGFTASADFPTVNPLPGCPGCPLSGSMFLTEFSPAGAILFSTFLGSDVEALSIHLDASGNVYLTGESASEGLPPAPGTPIPACMNPIQSTNVGSLDAFVVKVSPGTGQSTTTAVSSSANPSVFGQLVTFTASVKPVVCTAAVPAGTVTFLDGTAVLGTANLTNGTAPFPAPALSPGNHSITASYGGSGISAASSSPPLIQTVNNTPTGSNVTVQPVDTTTGTSPVTLTFSNVTQAGVTSLTTIPTGPPPPAGFQLGSPAEYFELSTTAVFSGTVRVCINYNGITFSGPPALFHFENGAWVNITTSVDPVSKVICGLATSFSRFAVFQGTDTTPPVTTATPSPGANANGWNRTDVTITLSSTDSEAGGTGVKQIQFALTGAEAGAGTVNGSTATVSLTVEGETTLTYFATDNAGNHETPKKLTMRIDKTPPVISGMPRPGCIVPTDNNGSGDHGDMVHLATITAADALSGLAPGSLRVTGTSNQPSEDRRKPQIVIAPNSSGGLVVRVLADSSGDSPRVYTLTATASDLAGNTATVTRTCMVPNEDQESEGGSRQKSRVRRDR